MEQNALKCEQVGTKVTNVTKEVTGQKPDKKRTTSKRRTSVERDMMKAVRAAERTAGDGADIGGTGFTILKKRQAPLERLTNEGKIGMEELQAAQEIEAAIRAIAGCVMMRGIQFERVDSCGAGGGLPTSFRNEKLIARYTSWANHWSRIAKITGNPTLEVVIAAVVDERSMRDIAADVERDRARVQRGVICGLRDYAARAGIVTGGRAQAWIDEAAQVFTVMPPKLVGAIRRARIEV